MLSRLESVIVLVLLRNKNESMSGYDIHRAMLEIGCECSHQQVYREMNRMVSRGIIQATEAGLARSKREMFNNSLVDAARWVEPETYIDLCRAIHAADAAAFGGDVLLHHIAALEAHLSLQLELIRATDKLPRSATIWKTINESLGFRIMSPSRFQLEMAQWAALSNLAEGQTIETSVPYMAFTESEAQQPLNERGKAQLAQVEKRVTSWLRRHPN